MQNEYVMNNNILLTTTVLNTLVWLLWRYQIVALLAKGEAAPSPFTLPLGELTAPLVMF